MHGGAGQEDDNRGKDVNLARIYQAAESNQAKGGQYQGAGIRKGGTSRIIVFQYT